jgi:hypothetical protein
MASARNGVEGASGPKICPVMLLPRGADEGAGAGTEAVGGPNAGSAVRLRSSTRAPIHPVAYSNTTTTAIQVKICS